MNSDTAVKQPTAVLVGHPAALTADAHTSTQPRRKARRHGASAHTTLSAHGAPMVWLTGGAGHGNCHDCWSVGFRRLPGRTNILAAACYRTES